MSQLKTQAGTKCLSCHLPPRYW